MPLPVAHFSLESAENSCVNTYDKNRVRDRVKNLQIPCGLLFRNVPVYLNSGNLTLTAFPSPHAIPSLSTSPLYLSYLPFILNLIFSKIEQVFKQKACFVYLPTLDSSPFSLVFTYQGSKYPNRNLVY